MSLKIVLTVLFAYLLGAMPTSYIIVRIVKHTDIRKHGSGNTGATNVFRVAGKIPAIATLVIDILKGTAAVLLIPAIFGISGTGQPELWRAVTALGAVFGHNWPVFLRFRGGKGVATTLGVYLGLCWPAFIIGALVNIVLLMISRRMSVASIGGGAAVPVYLAIASAADSEIPGVYFIVSIILTILLVISHRENIKRLMRGEEKKIF